MISKADKSTLRSSIFKHLDGLVCVPSVMALHRVGVLKSLHEGQTASVKTLAKDHHANEGYLNVALRTMSSQGWMDQVSADEPAYQLNSKGKLAIKHIEQLAPADSLLQLGAHFHPRKFERPAFEALLNVFKHYQRAADICESLPGEEQVVFQQLLHHIEGVILGPSIVHLGMNGMFHKYFMEASFKAEEFHADPDSFEQLLDIFTYFGWFSKQADTYEFTEKGLFLSKRASAYGVTVSYLPTLRSLDELIFGNPTKLRSGSNGDEVHVDRAMNVWGSGGAHATYFKVVDEFIMEIFNRPIAEQPKGILDMGCGNGAFLQHLFGVIEKHTLRGKMLDEHPLILVGVDYNQAALKITKANLIQADIWAKVVWGDIGDPDGLAKDLKDNYGIELGSLLNARTFLDHNRPWKAPEQQSKRDWNCTGAYASMGQRLNNNDVVQSFIEHMNRWQPYVKKHGLLVIELHTISPAVCAENLGKTGATAYDATHGYSDQYILELNTYLKAIEAAGLSADPRLARSFPEGALATVSINLLRA